MPELNDYTLEQLLAVGTLSDAPEDIQSLSERQIDELRLLQIREIMRVYSAMRATVQADDPKTWVYGDEADAYFDQHIWAWHVDLLLNLLDEARQGKYRHHSEDVPQPATGPLPFPYNVYEDGDLKKDTA